MLQKQPYADFMAALARNMKRCAITYINCVDVSTILECELKHVNLSMSAGHMQWRQAVLVSLVHVGSILEQNPGHAYSAKVPGSLERGLQAALWTGSKV